MLQRQLSEFLYAELLHTLGSYRVACDRLETLLGELRGAEGRQQSAAERELETAAIAALHCNEHLRDNLHRPAKVDGVGSEAGRRPSPFPGEPWDLPTTDLLGAISNFYTDSAAALTLYFDDQAQARSEKASPAQVLGARFAFVHDPQRRGRFSGPQPDDMVARRIDRTWTRLEKVHELLPGTPMPPRPVAGSTLDTARIERILEGCADGDEHSLLLTILQAMSEAHMWMHEAEHFRAQSFGEMFTRIPETHAESQRMLRYSLVLNTFVFVAARAAPWIFAEDEEERDQVIREYATCCNALAPTYCMWIAAQFSLLALHRRAFTWWTMGKHDRAYRDFYKLTRLLRGLRKPAERRGLRVPGTQTFIEGVTGMSEHHIGRIYRGQHAHRMALRYFKRASQHLKDWEEHEEIGPLVKNSHWRLNLLINEGKANYELGRVKRSILYYARAWRAFLLLVESETHATANVEVVEKFVEWLTPIVDEPELNRRELRLRLEPLVEQFGTLRSPAHLRLLAADIVMRMGHLLFILKLPPAGQDSGEDPAEPPRSDHDLAARCIGKAALLDPTSTLTTADLLKIQHETGKPVEPAKLKTVTLADQWPSGSGRFEEAARITEYTLQKWLAATAPAGGADELVDSERIARDLLGAFLAHTDSSNVKLAQVYRYLMREGGMKTQAAPGEYTLDFVCLRRYSSFFPFLPRPSAFRAPGGGYFVQVHEPEGGLGPFGIAVDPGPDFIENLYRCGYALADIQMIVLTHDHADHIASLDALLALLANRKGLGDDTFDGKEGKRLAIIGNESVYRRYSFFNEARPLKPAAHHDAVRVLDFEDIGLVTGLDGAPRADAIKERGILRMPETLRIEPVQTWGHTDANGYVAQGFLLSCGVGENRSSILFTGDTGAPPDFELSEGEDAPDPLLLAKGEKGLRQAVEEADLVVAHLSSVPLRELRELAKLRTDGKGADEVISEYAELWSTAAAEADSEGEDRIGQEGIEQTQFLLNQIQFGFRSRPRERGKNFHVSPFSDFEEIRKQSAQHLYLTGLVRLAEIMAAAEREQAPLLLIGELREELGTFRTRIASGIADAFFRKQNGRVQPSALTADIGLRVRLSRPAGVCVQPIAVLCTTCDLDNDLIPAERFHRPHEVHEVCVKGEDEGVFYNCHLHDPRRQSDSLWLESVERYDVFGE